MLDGAGVVWVSAAAGGSAVVAAAVPALVALRRGRRWAAAVTRRLTRLDERLAGVGPQLHDGLRPRLEGLADEMVGVSAGLTELSRASAANYEQLEAYIDLRSLVRPRAPMPPLRGWAASPDVLRHLTEVIARRHPKLIVECGSGSSSVWLGYLAEQTASAQVVCLEHDERYAELTRELIRAHSLESVVEVRSAPLADWTSGGRAYPWYAAEAVDGLADIGVLFVDGPPAATGPEARYPAIPLLLPRCAADAVIVLDDSRRAEESSLSDRWLAEHPDLERSVLPFEKGAHVFTRRAT